MLAGMLVTGCGLWHKSPPSSGAGLTRTIVTPDTSLTAKVVSVNEVGRFVVLGFPPGKIPRLDQTLFLYRAGLKVAAVRVTGPQTENNIVADLSTGTAQVGDEVRDQ